MPQSGDDVADMVVRPLRPEDVADCAALHVEAFPGFFLSQLGPRFLREFYRGFLGDPDAVALVAESPEGDVAGVVVGTLEPKGFFSRLLRRRLVGFLIASFLVVLRRPTAAPRLFKAVLYRGQVPLEVEGALVSSICVVPHGQARGTGTQLITAFAEAIACHGSGAYLLTDRDHNERANAFYVRNGWRLAGSYDTAEGRGMNCYVLGRPEGQQR